MHHSPASDEALPLRLQRAPHLRLCRRRRLIARLSLRSLREAPQLRAPVVEVFGVVPRQKEAHCAAMAGRGVLSPQDQLGRPRRKRSELPVVMFDALVDLVLLHVSDALDFDGLLHERSALQQKEEIPGPTTPLILGAYVVEAPELPRNYRPRGSEHTQSGAVRLCGTRPRRRAQASEATREAGWYESISETASSLRSFSCRCLRRSRRRFKKSSSWDEQCHVSSIGSSICRQEHAAVASSAWGGSCRF